jgi:hypothetical protein
MDGNFLGETEDLIDQAGFIKSKLKSLNCFPPPDRPLFQESFLENSSELVRMIEAAGLPLDRNPAYADPAFRDPSLNIPPDREDSFGSKGGQSSQTPAVSLFVAGERPAFAKVEFVQSVERRDGSGLFATLYTLYEFRATAHDGRSWLVLKRYSEFHDLKAALVRASAPGAANLPLPEKRFRMRGKGDNQKTLHERKDGLVMFMTVLLQMYPDNAAVAAFMRRPDAVDAAANPAAHRPLGQAPAASALQASVLAGGAGEPEVGAGRTLALHHRAAASYQIH